MRRQVRFARFLLAASVTVFWTILLLWSSKAQSTLSSSVLPGIASAFRTTEVPDFSCCEDIALRESKKGVVMTEQIGKTEVVANQRSVRIAVKFHIILICKPRDPRDDCIGKFDAKITENPTQLGNNPTASSVALTTFAKHKCAKKKEKFHRHFDAVVFTYNATYGGPQPITGTLKLDLDIDQKKGLIKHTYSVSVKTKAGAAVDLSDPTVVGRP